MLLDKFCMFALPVVNIKISIYRGGGGGGGTGGAFVTRTFVRCALLEIPVLNMFYSFKATVQF